MNDLITLEQLQKVLLVTDELTSSDHVMVFYECLPDGSYEQLDVDSDWKGAKDMWIGQVFFGLAVDEEEKPIPEIATLISILFRDKERALTYVGNANSGEGVDIPVLKVIRSRSPIKIMTPLDIETEKHND